MRQCPRLHIAKKAHFASFCIAKSVSPAGLRRKPNAAYKSTLRRFTPPVSPFGEPAPSERGLLLPQFRLRCQLPQRGSLIDCAGMRRETPPVSPFGEPAPSGRGPYDPAGLRRKLAPLRRGNILSEEEVLLPQSQNDFAVLSQLPRRGSLMSAPDLGGSSLHCVEVTSFQMGRFYSLSFACDVSPLGEGAL